MTTVSIGFRARLAIVAVALGLTLAQGDVRSARASTFAEATADRSALAFEQTTTAPGPTLDDLRGVDELKAMFNRDAGKHRLLLLLSPT